MAQSIRLDGLRVLGEQQVRNDCDGELILLRKIVCLDRRVVTISCIGRRNDNARVIALRRAENLIEISLLRFGGDTGRWTAPLDFDDHYWRFDHSRLSDGLC